jgi:hypothetical protein
MKSVLGWSDNAAIPAGDVRHADPKVFKAPKCTFGK